MAITSCLTTSFRLELLQAIHDFDNDVFKIALYTSSATLGLATTAYSDTNEITGTGYTAAGKIASVSTGYPVVDAGRGVVRFDDLTWTSATFTTRGGLLYNSSKSNRAIAVLDFGIDVSPTAGPFTISMPLASEPIVVIT